MKCKHCYAPLRSGDDFCQYCGTPIVFKKEVGANNTKNSRNEGEQIHEQMKSYEEQMRSYEGSPEFQKMMRGENIKKETSNKNSSNNLGCLQSICEFFIYCVILAIFPESFGGLIVGTLYIYWGYRFFNFIRNKLK